MPRLRNRKVLPKQTQQLVGGDTPVIQAREDFGEIRAELLAKPQRHLAPSHKDADGAIMSALRVVLSAAAPHTVPATYVHKDARQSTCKCKCTQAHIDNAEQIRQSHTLTRLSEKMVLLRDSTTTLQPLAATLSRSDDMV